MAVRLRLRLRLKRVDLVITHVNLFQVKVSHGRPINDVIFFLVHSYGRSDNSTVVMEINKDQLSH
jgi:hypothetical protein